jgi:phenylalanyl-tRNA synthetase beta chain
MHTAEVEEIIYEAENLKSVYVWEIKEVKKHPEADKLNICKVEVLGEEKQIVCWAPNVKVWLKVAVAVVWAKLAEDFVIKKTKIRWETSEGMMCSLDELWLCKERQEGIMELNKDAKLWLNMREYLKKDDIILEVDNKAINHRPDLFSHIWIIRELYAINNEKFDFEYASRDFGKLKDLWIKNEIPEAVKRYIWIKIENVSNIESPEYIKQVLNSFDTWSKWLLIDVTNYSLYLYWQPTHCFDADKISGKITIRYAKKDEPFTSLKDIDYKLSEQDIVIADEEKVLALGWVIWGKSSATSDETKNIVIESAHFDQAVVRKTWKKYWIRTDSLNVFEKDILKSMNIAWASLIVEELEKNLENIKLVSYSDCYEEKQKEVKIPFDLEYINNLLW